MLTLTGMCSAYSEKTLFEIAGLKNNVIKLVWESIGKQTWKEFGGNFEGFLVGPNSFS